MKEAIDLLLAFIKKPQVVSDFAADDWNRLISQARFHELMVLVHDILQQRDLISDTPVEIDELLRGYSNRQAYLTTLFQWEIGLVRRLADEVDYPVLVLKGMAYVLAELGSWKSRAFADIDVLVAPRNFTDFEGRLQRSGWESKPLNDYDDHYYRQWSHASPPLVNRNSGIELDLHHHISSPISDQPIDTGSLLDEAVAIGNSGFYRLGDEDLILHCANHFIYFDDLQGRFKDLVLIYRILLASDNPDLWPSLDRRARQLGLQTTFYYLVRLLQYYFAVDVPHSVVARLDDTPLRRAVMWLLTNSLTPFDNRGVRLAVIQFLLVARYQWTRYPAHILAYHLLRKHVGNRVAGLFKRR